MKIPICSWILIGLLYGTLLLSAGCNPAPSSTPEKSAPAPDTPSVMLTPSVKLDIGDVESSLRLEATLSKDSASATVTEKTEETIRGALNMSTINISTPPPQLWLRVRIDPGIGFNYVKRPVLVRGSIIRDNQTIDTFETIVGRNSSRTETIEISVLKPLEFKVDVLQGLTPIPDTLLVHAQAELTLLPEGVDESTVNAAQINASADSKTTVISNPVRINIGAPVSGL